MRTKLVGTTVITVFLASLLSMASHAPSVSAAIPGAKFGNALEFDGVSDFVTVPDSPSLRTLSTELTVEAWVYFPSNSSGLQLLIRKWIDSEGGWMSYVLGKAEDNKIYGGVSNQALSQFPGWTTTQTITALGIEDTWVHVAFTWKKNAITAADGQIFVNGSSVTTTFQPADYSAAFTIGYGNYSLFFARKADTLSFSTSYFKGALDEIRISNIARTSFDLTAPPSLDNNTVAIWHFDEGTGLTASDVSANANHGTINGATWTGLPIPEFSAIMFITTAVLLTGVVVGVRKIVKKPLT